MNFLRSHLKSNSDYEQVEIGFMKLLDGYRKDPKTFLLLSPTEFSEMVVIKKIPFYSVCEHHAMPYFGHFTVGYVPDKFVLRESEFSVIFDVFSHRLTTQDGLTMSYIDFLQNELSPKGIGLIVSGNHACVSLPRSQNTSEVVTSATRGVFKKHRIKSEFLVLSENNR